jgi:hypothetical protein
MLSDKRGGVMFATILALADKVLELVVLKEKNKYRDKRIQLEKAYYEEYNKPLSDRSDAVLDNLWFELRILVNSILADIGKPDA